MTRGILITIFFFISILAYFSLKQEPVNSSLKKTFQKSSSYEPKQIEHELLSPQELAKKSLEDQAEYQKILESDSEFNEALANLQQELTSDAELKQATSGTNLDLSPPNEPTDPDLTNLNNAASEPSNNSSNDYFELTPAEQEALNNSGTPNNNSGLIGGVHNRTASEAIPVTDDSEDQQTTAEAFQELPLLTGQPRGYVMLYLMHPKARETVDAQIEALVVSGIQNLYLSVLIDGTFNKDFEYLKNNIKKLSDNCESLTLALYLSNGSTMRRWNQTDILAGFNGIEPKVFRDLIQTEERAKNEFQAIVRDAESIFAYNSALSLANKNIAIVMLEDNLQKDSYVAMRNIARDILGDRVQYIRNPCPGCYPGNDTATDGDAIEIHDPEGVFQIASGTGFTNDGKGYRFATEPTANDKILIDDLEDRMITADSRGGKYFGLWRSERQGYSIPPVHPDLRTYEVPTVKQLITEIQMLRSGLTEVTE